MSKETHPLAKEMELALQLARWAGRAQRNSGHPSSDLAARELRRVAEIRIHESFPDDVVVTDPGASPEGRLSAGRVWFIDPLHGAKASIPPAGGPCVVIGLAIAGRPALGVVHRPMVGETYEAVVGGGAWFFDGRRRRRLMADASAPTGHLQVLGEPGVGYARIAHTLGIEFDGGPAQIAASPALRAVLVAGGQTDVALHTGRDLTEIDTCAADAILLEAGGCMSDCLGEPLRYNKADLRHMRGVLARGPLVGREVTLAIRSAVAA